MKTSAPKVLEEVLGEALISHVLGQALKLKTYIKQIIVVVGYQGKIVEKEIKKKFPNKKIEFVYQKGLLGTADAVKICRKKVKNEKVLILCGDVPLIQAKTITTLIKRFLAKKLPALVLTACFSGKNSLGSIIRDSQGRLMAIAEKLTLNLPFQAKAKEEINSGIYCFDKKVLFGNLALIKKNPKKGEYFLTDMVKILYNRRIRFDSIALGLAEEVLGINTQADLQKASKAMQKRLIEAMISRGVKIIDPDTIRIESGVKIGKNTLIYPFTYIEKGVIIGSNCSLGPFLHLRGNTSIGNDCCLGNFLEVNRCKIGKRVKMKHFGYLGDALVADDVNLGAGTVIANYNGKHKNKTYIAKGAFIGSDSVLVAPVRIGASAMTGAGSVVTKDVGAAEVVVGVPAKFLKKRKG